MKKENNSNMELILSTYNNLLIIRADLKEDEVKSVDDVLEMLDGKIEEINNGKSK